MAVHKLFFWGVCIFFFFFFWGGVHKLQGFMISFLSDPEGSSGIAGLSGLPVAGSTF